MAGCLPAMMTEWSKDERCGHSGEGTTARRTGRRAGQRAVRSGGEGVVDREGREEEWCAAAGGWRGAPVNHVREAREAGGCDQERQEMDKERVRHEERRERTRWEEMDRGGKKESEGKGRWKAGERRRGSCMPWEEGGKEMTTPRQSLLCIDCRPPEYFTSSRNGSAMQSYTPRCRTEAIQRESRERCGR